MNIRECPYAAGDKVLCVQYESGFPDGWPQLTVGAVYTVKDILLTKTGFIEGVYLVEVPHFLPDCNKHYDLQPAYISERFTLHKKMGVKINLV